jgi:hypothetical protein
MAYEEARHAQDEVLAALQRDLEAARYSARRAEKQFQAADPDNRLVADELERRWEIALQRVQELERHIEQHPAGDRGAFAYLNPLWRGVQVIQTAIERAIDIADDAQRLARRKMSLPTAQSLRQVVRPLVLALGLRQASVGFG